MCCLGVWLNINTLELALIVADTLSDVLCYREMNCGEVLQSKATLKLVICRVVVVLCKTENCENCNAHACVFFLLT